MHECRPVGAQREVPSPQAGQLAPQAGQHAVVVVAAAQGHHSMHSSEQRGRKGPFDCGICADSGQQCQQSLMAVQLDTVH